MPAVALLLAVFGMSSECRAQETPEQRGYRALLTVPLAPPALTEQDYFDLWQFWPEPERSLAEKATPEDRRRMSLARYGFQESPDRPGPIPQQFTSDGKGNLTVNCLACHGGPVAGKVVLGLGNSLLDLASFLDDVSRLSAARGLTPRPLTGPKLNIPQAPVRGLNNAWGMAIAFMLVRDRDLNVTAAPEFPVTPAQLDIPMKTPPYWLSNKKTRYYEDAFIEKSHRDIMQFTFVPSVPPQQIFANEAIFKDIFTWINSVEAPQYPFPIDKALAQQGVIVFITHCASCHGTYGPGGRYPERLVAADDVGTDPVRVRDFPAAFVQHLGAGWTGDYGKTPLYPSTNSYIAQPLDGIWANAPYLHNGSVPTLWDLLTPDSRPGIWRRTESGYDQHKLGLEVMTYGKLPDDATTPEQKRLYYQTSLRGLSNQGHRYPTAGLSDPDKRALIEYLKTL
jgi:mono/diheme cytochrome c family protein